MKVDKEALIKHRFWIALGAYGLVWLLLLLMMPIQIGSAAGDARKKYTEALDAVGKVKTEYANANWVAPLQTKEEELKKRKVVVWQKAWDTQKDLMTWPPDRDNIAPLDRELKDAYFLDPIANPGERKHYAETLYAPQYAEFKNAIFPAYYEGGSYEAILKPVKFPPDVPPASDDCWFAQEDLWVKRDVIGAIRNALDTVAAFTPDQVDWKKEAPPAGAVAAYRFHNVNWEVTLALENTKQGLGISPKSTIKNINVDQRRLPLAGVALEIDQKAKSGASRGPNFLVVEGEPLEWGKTAEIKKPVLVDTFKAEEPLEVRQVFNWFTSPVKRLDRLELGTRAAESHRFSKFALQTKSLTPKDDSTPPPPADNAGGGFAGGSGMMPGAPPGGAPGSLGMGPGGAGGKNADAAAVVERNRYLDLSDQVRRMPVAMVLVVDQARIPDVLTALANSRLHIWVTQWDWQHVHGVQPPARGDLPSSGDGESRDTAGGPGSGPMGPGSMRPGSMGPGSMGSGMKGGSGMMRPPGGGNSGYSGGSSSPAPGMMRPPGGGSSGYSGGSSSPAPGMMGRGPFGGQGGFPSGFFNNSPEASGADQDDPNLVELVVYGIASLYERYPPKAATGDNGPNGPTTTPVTPAKP